MKIARVLIIGAAVVLAAASTTPAIAAEPTLTPTTYDVAGATSTVVAGVNDSGAIAGYYTDGTGSQHGFIDTNGAVVTFDAPTGSTGYKVTSMNNAKTVTGVYWTGSTEHGFIRTLDGTVATLDYPKVPVMSQQGTYVSQINNDGVVVGYYFTARDNAYVYPNGTQRGPSTAYHGFVWKIGKFTSYDAPGTSTPRNGAEFNYGTQLLGLNTTGDMVGVRFVNTTEPTEEGFELSGVTFGRNNAATTSGKSVTFTSFVDPIGPGGGCGFTVPTAINDAGVIVGNSGNGCAPLYYVFEITGGALTDVYATDDPGGSGTNHTVFVANSINNATVPVIGGTSYDWLVNPTPDAGPLFGPNHGFTGTIQ